MTTAPTGGSLGAAAATNLVFDATIKGEGTTDEPAGVDPDFTLGSFVPVDAAVVAADHVPLADLTTPASPRSHLVPIGLAIGTRTINAQTGTSYTVTTADVGRLVTLDNSSAITCALAAIPIGQTVEFLVLGTGQVTWTLASGTLRCDGATAKSARQGARVWAQRITSTLVSLWGSLAAS